MLIFYRMRNVLIIRCLSSCGGGGILIDVLNIRSLSDILQE